MSTHNEKDDAPEGTTQNSPDAATEPATQEAATVKELTIPASIRLSQSAFNALKALMGKYGKNMVAMASICIIAYAKNAAASATVKFRTLEDKTLFALQASATDIQTGLSNLRNDLYLARKSHRDPKAAKALYEKISDKYEKTIAHAADTLDLMEKELCLTEILADADHKLLPEIIEKLANKEPSIQFANTERKQLLKILLALKS